MHKDVVLINEASNLAVCTLWTKKEEVLSKLPENVQQKIAIIGTLYSKHGVNYIIETLGRYPLINTLIVYGADLSESGSELFKVFGKKDTSSLKIDQKLAKEIVNTVNLIDLREEFKKGDLETLIHTINKHYDENPKPARSLLKIKIEEALGVSSWPASTINLRIYETSIFWAWVKLLHAIYSYGSLKFSEYGEKQKEVVNLSVTIALYGKKYELDKEFFEVGFAEDRFKKHVKEVLTSEKPEGVEYTYGERLRRHPIGKDQINFIIDKLGRTPYSRRAVGVTWFHEKDMKSSNPPCIVAVQGIFIGDYYHHFVYIRSNDMFDGWPINMYGQIKLAEYIVNEINKKFGTNYKVGTVTTTSVSAHIYEHSFNQVKEILSKYSKKAFQRFIPDQLGNFVIYQEGNHIVVEQRVQGELIFREKFSSFEEAYNFFKPVVAFLDPQHAFYLGAELRKAFDKVEKGEKYMQDEV
jgi:thymidylate synthase